MGNKIILKTGTVSSFDKITAKSLGSTYLATDGTKKAYLYYDNGTNKLNIVPRLLGVENGGTGKNTFDNHGILYGNGTGAIQETAKGASGQLLGANSSGIPVFYTPTLSWDADNHKLYLSLPNGKNEEEPIPAATESQWGLMTNAAQTFGGTKTFQNDITLSAGLNFGTGTRVTYTSNTVTIAFDS